MALILNFCKEMPSLKQLAVFTRFFSIACYKVYPRNFATLAAKLRLMNKIDAFLIYKAVCENDDSLPHFRGFHEDVPSGVIQGDAAAFSFLNRVRL